MGMKFSPGLPKPPITADDFCVMQKSLFFLVMKRSLYAFKCRFNND